MHDPEAQADTDQLTVTRSIETTAPLDVVWDTLTNPRWIADWFGTAADFPDGMEPGALGRFSFGEHGDCQVRIEEYAAPSRFGFSWTGPGQQLSETTTTTATFTLERSEDLTRITVVETGFETLGDQAAARAALEDNRQGWTGELDDLVATIARRWSGASVDPAAGTITRTIDLDAPIQQVWDRLTDPVAIERWWGHPADFPDGMAAGSSGTFAHQGETFPIDIITFEAPRRWEFRWGNLGEDSPGPQATDVRFDLAELEGGTRLRVVEIGWMRVDSDRRAEGMQENARGWNHVLDSLRADLAS
ncbi:SRPBCC domain-containing protein [Parenemella sanctibonifatiensis]|uniref:SRPBCC domain-containing protein n=1 Tax=Parenemella sanctibonifatiensis TaxID=2016505 RepID=UPI0015C6656E|nr:SRPBCC domain-containing protein [Parenemella sanctibonifatiensis]